MTEVPRDAFAFLASRAAELRSSEQTERDGRSGKRGAGSGEGGREGSGGAGSGERGGELKNDPNWGGQEVTTWTHTFG